MPHSEQKKITVEALAQHLELRFEGEADRLIASVASFSRAGKSDLCFLKSSKFIDQLQQSQCAAVIVPLDFEQTLAHKTILYSANPHLSFVEAIHFLQQDKVGSPAGVIHPSAIVADTVSLGREVSIGAQTVIGDRVRLGDGVRIGAGCVIEDDVRIGAHSRIMANVTLCYDTLIGDHAIFQPGVVIGGDGFGLVYDQGRWVKIPHLGRVVIGNRVEIGANTTVDRGALDDTVIEDGVKIDNLIQIGHNARIGENTAIAAHAAIAGSAIIGKNCKISGAVAIAGHLTIADGVTITGMSMVTKSINSSGTYSSGTPLMENRLWHRSNVRYKSLDKIAKQLSGLDEKINNKEAI